MKALLAFSGSHGTGKTTAAYQRAVELKMMYPNQSVIALCNQEALCPYAINKDATETSQMYIFTNQIRSELEMLSRFDIVVTDRTVVDVVAYTMACGFKALGRSMNDLCQNHMHHYRQIIFRSIKTNNHCHPDGIRETKDPEFRRDVEHIIEELYQNMEKNFLKQGTLIYV